MKNTPKNSKKASADFPPRFAFASPRVVTGEGGLQHKQNGIRVWQTEPTEKKREPVDNFL